MDSSSMKVKGLTLKKNQTSIYWVPITYQTLPENEDPEKEEFKGTHYLFVDKNRRTSKQKTFTIRRVINIVYIIHKLFREHRKESNTFCQRITKSKN